MHFTTIIFAVQRVAHVLIILVHLDMPMHIAAMLLSSGSYRPTLDLGGKFGPLGVMFGPLGASS